MRRALGLTCTAVVMLAARADVAASQQTAGDDALRRVEQLVASGDRAAAHRLADSLVAAADAASPRYPEMLYWRAFSSSNAADAERDYLRLAIEYPLAPKAEDGLYLLAQLKYARSDRAGALRHLDRLVRDHPSGRNVGRASLLTARIAFDSGDEGRGCGALALAREKLPADDVETRNQLEYLTPRCVTAATPPVGQPPVSGDSSRAAQGAPTTTSASGEWSVQVAAYNSSREARALASRLTRRGFVNVRVAGARAPYRVRIGRYATRADAETALERIKRAKLSGIVVEAEPR